MKIDPATSNERLLELIGERLAQLRLAKNLTQKQVADQAGLSLRTVQRLELGSAATQLSGFASVCRVLGLLEGFDAFIPEPAASPMAQLKLQGKKRQRASSPNPNWTVAEPKKWTWGKSS